MYVFKGRQIKQSFGFIVTFKVKEFDSMMIEDPWLAALEKNVISKKKCMYWHFLIIGKIIDIVMRLLEIIVIKITRETIKKLSISKLITYR